MRAGQRQQSPQNPHRSRAYLAKEPQQGGFKGHICSVLTAISLARSRREGGLEARALLQVRADSHLPEAQLEVAPAERQHGQPLHEPAEPAAGGGPL